jgi:protein TonB
MQSQPRLRVLEGGANGAEATESPRPRKRVFVPVELPEEEPWWDRSLAIGLLLALLVNGALGWYVFRYQPELIEEVLAPIEFVLVEPPPPPEPEPEPEPTPIPVVKKKKIETPPPTMTETAPPPTNEPPPPPIFGVSLDSTTKGGAFKARVGNTLMKEPEKEVTDPSEVKALPRVAFSRITEAPRLISDYKVPEYPPAPLEEGIEGTVTLTFTVDEKGKTLDVVVVRGVHPALDAAAKAAVKRFRYKPGMQDGKPVITTGVSHNYKWIIEE